MLLRHSHSSRRFIVAITCTVITLFHKVGGFPVLVKKAGVVLGSPLRPNLPNSGTSWFDDSAAVSALVTRSSDDVVHDSVFIPTIATMGVLVIICIFCSYNLIVNKDTARSRGKLKYLILSRSKQSFFCLNLQALITNLPFLAHNMPLDDWIAITRVDH